MQETREELIRTLAYNLWDTIGCPEGRTQECWHEAERQVDAARAGVVRPAGTVAMKNPPPDWDMTDQESDESFPASDPPGNY